MFESVLKEGTRSFAIGAGNEDSPIGARNEDSPNPTRYTKIRRNELINEI